MADSGFVVSFQDGIVQSIEKEDTVHIDGVYDDFDSFFNELASNISSMNLKHSDTNQIFILFAGLSNKINALLSKRLSQVPGCNEIIIEALCRNLEYVESRFRDQDSRNKRQKIVSVKTSYVAPQEKAIALKWKTKSSSENVMPLHTMEQATMQYVPILETLRAMFSVDKFKDEYFLYNEVHKCKPGVFENYCCAETSKRSEFLNRDRNTIQIQLSTDDFEVCCPLKSKAKIHKLCAVYFQLRNVPEHLRSQLCYHNLVCLCSSHYLKNSEGFNIISELIVKELQILETEGIEIDTNVVLRGALVNICADNLGANSVLGFTESFSSTYYCRQYECTKEECNILEREDGSKLRSKSSYNKCIEAIQTAKRIELKKTKGIKTKCLFNELNNFHIVDNWSIDLMHDVNEGCIKYLLEHLFSHWCSNAVLREEEIQCMIRDFNYGILSARNKPSLISIDKKNIGQSASQLYCIMVHMPYIFYNVKDKIAKEWVLCDLLLDIMQIVYSKRISESHILKLEPLIEKFLSNMKSILNQGLKPKHHFLTHYPSLIRKMGPPIHSWMMRNEAKHKEFTNMAKSTNNFRNIPKTLAERHQQNHVFANMSFDISIVPSQTRFAWKPESSEYNQLIQNYFGSIWPEFIQYKFLNILDNNIRKGLFVFSEKKPFEIEVILSSNDDAYYVICNDYAIVRYNYFLKSIEIEKTGFKSIFKLNELAMKTYEKMCCDQSCFIIIETLDLLDVYA